VALIINLLDMNLLKSQIEQAFQNNDPVCICFNKVDWNKRVIGYVKDVGASNKFKLEVLDEFGRKTKVESYSLASIKSLEIGGIYNDNLKKLSNGEFSKIQSVPKYYTAGMHNLGIKLSKLKASRTLCTFFFKTEFSIGIVADVNQEEFSIKNIASDGTADGISVFDIAVLTRIRCRTNFENRIFFLTEK
jgi:hypothetical protein